MKILGIVAEYNPFHLGHKYQLEKALKLSKCDAAVAVMSGNYVQRGEPAIVDKYTRSEIAVKSGVDLVIELPLPFSCQSAELFAFGAIKELKKLNVSTISFGCENADINMLHKIADIQTKNSEEYTAVLKKYMGEGLSYPNAVNNAVKGLINENSDIYDSLILSPNNTLGLEYIKTADKIGFDVEFLPIKRHLAQHNETGITDNFASATAIRNALSELNFEKIKKSLTSSSYINLKKYYKENKIFNCLDYYLDFIYYRVISCGKAYLKNIYDMSEGLENKIYDNVYRYKNLNDYIMSIKSKRYTYSRIRRILLNILLNITYDDMVYFKNNDNNYVKALAFSENGKKIIKHAKNNETVVITKYSDYRKNGIYTDESKLFNLTDKSNNLYYLPFADKSNYLNTEYTKNVLYVK